mgnify:CR=1 FL=1
MPKMHHRKMRHSLTAILLLLLVFTSTGCSDSLDMITLQIGENTLLCEIARSEQEQARGLMFRKSLPEDNGMLFVYSADRRMSYWMKDTEIPLSIAFISSDGFIKEIYDLKPFSLNAVLSKQSVRYALEVNQGYFQRNSISEGDKIIFPADFQ